MYLFKALALTLILMGAIGCTGNEEDSPKEDDSSFLDDTKAPNRDDNPRF